MYSYLSVFDRGLIRAELRREIINWLSSWSGLDFSRIHLQHVLERKEGSGDISPSVKTFSDEWLADESDTWWLKGVCKLAKPIKLGPLLTFILQLVLENRSSCE